MRYTTTFICSVFLLLLLSGCTNAADQHQLSIGEFLSALELNGLKVGEKSDKAYGLIMAVDGTGVKVNDESLEVYQYDTTIKSGKEAIKKWNAEGIMGQPVIVNKNLLIIKKPKHPEWERIVDIFNGL